MMIMNNVVMVMEEESRAVTNRITISVGEEQISDILRRV